MTIADVGAPPRRRRVRWYVLGLVFAVCVLLAAVAWVGVRALLVKNEVEAIQSLTTRMTTALAARDLDEVGSANRELAVHAHRAAELSGDPLWGTAESLPLLGPNLAAVRLVAEGVDTLSTQVVAPILAASTALSESPDPLGAPLAAAVAAGGPIDRPAAELHGLVVRLDRVSAVGLVPQVSDGLTKVRTVAAEADAVLRPLATSAQALPEILGSEQPRTLLLMIQNPAELRTGGGITGTFVQLRADEGRMTMQRMTDSSHFRHRDAPIIPISRDLDKLYGDVTGRFVQNASIPTDFALTSRLATSWWEADGGARPDAVISIDPVVLQSLLAVTGPVKLADGSTLSAGNLHERLLVVPYMTMTQPQQSAFFAQATTAIFGRLFTQGLTPVDWARALAQPVQDGRVSVWSADARAQAAIARGPLGGPLVRQRLAGDNAFGVYFNDNTGAKMASFMTTTISSATGTCRADGKTTVAVSVTLTSTAPAKAASWPFSMNGGGHWGIPPGDIGMNVTVAAPPGAFVDSVALDDRGTSAVAADAEGHPSSIAHVTLRPGDTQTLTFRFVTSRGGAVQIVHTPMLTDPAVATTVLRCG